MGNRVEIAEVKRLAAADPEGTYQAIGVTGSFKRSGQKLLAKCPFHGDDRESLQIAVSGDHAGEWFCVPCGKGGDIGRFVQKLRACTLPEALDELARALDLQTVAKPAAPGPPAKAPPEDTAPLPPPPPTEDDVPQAAGPPPPEAPDEGDPFPDTDEEAPSPPPETSPQKPPAKPYPSSRSRSKLKADGDEVPPHDINAERACLGSMLIEPEAVTTVLHILDAADFYPTEHQQIAKAIFAVAGCSDPVDLVTVSTELRERGQLDDVGGVVYLAALLDATPTAAHAERYASVIREKSVLRRIAERTEAIRRKASVPGGRLDELGVELAELAEVATRGSATDMVPFVWGDQLVANIETVRWFWKGWLPIGFTTLAAGDPAVYKSATALWIAAQLGIGGTWPDGTKMDRKTRTCWLDAEGMQALNADRLRLWGFDPSCIMWMGKDGLDIPNLTKPGTLARYVRTAVAEGCGFVVLDCLRTAHQKDEKGSEIAALMAEIALVTRTFDISMLVLHHPRKRSTFETARLTLDRVRGGSEIGAAARVVWGFWVPNPGPAPAIQEVRVEVIKSNLGSFPDPWGVKWPKDAGLDFIGAPEERREPTQLERAEDWLRALLQNGAVAVRVIEDKGRALGFSESTLKRARWSLKLVPVTVKLRDEDRREMDVAGWGLPITDEKA